MAIKQGDVWLLTAELDLPGLTNTVQQKGGFWFE